MKDARDIPLCVDLDGTLLKTDLLHESLLLFVRTAPLSAPLLPFWLPAGKAAFKRRIAERVELDAAALPYREELVSWLREQKAAGRRLVLATASDAELARAVAGHVGLFDEVVASDGTTNAGGAAKRDLLVSRFGEKGFDYAGDAPVDLPVWSAARRAVLVGVSERLRAEVARGTEVEKEFPAEPPTLKALVKAIRVRQWVKNLLVFVPVLTALKLRDVSSLASAGLAFVALSLCASAIYVVNDLMDLPSDRAHRTKRKRPFASGALPVSLGAVLVPLLLLGSAAVAVFLPAPARILLATYLVSTTLYTFWLKKKVLVDVFALAFLYTLRVLLGGAAAQIPVSPWLLAFSIFVFLSLAFVKRASELFNLRLQNLDGASGRDWYVWDNLAVTVLGVASAYLAGLVLAIYVHSEDVKRLYRHPGWLWALVPLFLYWMSRIWILVGRGAMDEDPIVFATRDRVTFAIALLTAAFLAMAARGPFGPPGLME